MIRQLPQKVKRIIFYAALLVAVVCMVVPGWDKGSWFALIVAFSILFDKGTSARAEKKEQAEQQVPEAKEEKAIPEKTLPEETEVSPAEPRQEQKPEPEDSETENPGKK